MRQLLSSRGFVAICAVLVTAGVVGGVAQGVIPSGNTITACYKNENGQLRVIDPSASRGSREKGLPGDCEKSETQIAWSAAGPAGAVGPAGAAGPVGATGLAGAAGPAGPKGATGSAGAEGPAGPIGATGPNGAAGPAGAAGPKGDTGPQGNVGPAGSAGVGTGLASIDDLQGLPCKQSTGTIEISYENGTGNVSLKCKATTFYTLTLNVSGGYNEPFYYTYFCGPFGTSTCNGTGYNFRPQVVTGTAGIACAAVCTYPIPAGTQVTLSAKYLPATFVGATNGTAFTMAADTTVTVSGVS